MESFKYAVMSLGTFLRVAEEGKNYQWVRHTAVAWRIFIMAHSLQPLPDSSSLQIHA